MDEIAARLGYRLLLYSGTFGVSAAPGGKVPYSISIQNAGYAAPANERPFQLVLRETVTGAICAASDASQDVRAWFGGEMHDVQGNLALPGDLPEGTYELFLNLADESSNLRTNLDFKLKVANLDLNDEANGMINLQHSVTVASGESSAPSVSGPDISVACGMELDVLPPAVGPPTLLRNGGFEGSAGADWNEYMNGYALDQTFKHSGGQSVKIVNGGAQQVVVLEAEAGSQVTIKGYSKAVGTTVGLWDYGIYADVKYKDNTWLYGQIAKFPGGTHDFTLGQTMFEVPPGKTVASLSLYAMYRNDPLASGVAYFDDVEVIVEPALVKNGGFEDDPGSDWSNYGGGYTVDQSFKHSGEQSIKIVNGGAQQWIEVSAEAGSQVTIKGYGKAVGTSTGLWDYGIYADVKYTDDTWLYGQIANFPGGTHDFTLGQKTFEVPTGKTVAGMSLYAMYRNDSGANGVAYFDDVGVIVEVPSAASS